MTKEIDKRITDLHMAKGNNKESPYAKRTMLHEYNKLTECLESLVGDLQRFKVSTEDAVGSLKALVSYYSTEKVVFLNDEEHEFLVEELGENRIRSQELLDDESIALDDDDAKSGGYQDSIDGYKREVRLFDAVLKKIATKKGSKGKDYTPPIVCTYCHSSNVDVSIEKEIVSDASGGLSDNIGYLGYCHECKKEKTLTTLEGK